MAMMCEQGLVYLEKEKKMQMYGMMTSNLGSKAIRTTNSFTRCFLYIRHFTAAAQNNDWIAWQIDVFLSHRQCLCLKSCSHVQ